MFEVNPFSSVKALIESSWSYRIRIQIKFKIIFHLFSKSKSLNLVNNDLNNSGSRLIIASFPSSEQSFNLEQKILSKF